MKREYEKPQFKKAAVTLQAVTAVESRVTGSGVN
jgi:hypothetical protein